VGRSKHFLQPPPVAQSAELQTANGQAKDHPQIPGRMAIEDTLHKIEAHQASIEDHEAAMIVDLLMTTGHLRHHLAREGLIGAMATSQHHHLMGDTHYRQSHDMGLTVVTIDDLDPQLLTLTSLAMGEKVPEDRVSRMIDHEEAHAILVPHGTDRQMIVTEAIEIATENDRTILGISAETDETAVHVPEALSDVTGTVIAMETSIAGVRTAMNRKAKLRY